MKTEQIVEKLDEINKKMNGVIGRATPGSPCPPAELHQKCIEVGEMLDALINKLI